VGGQHKTGHIKNGTRYKALPCNAWKCPDLCQQQIPAWYLGTRWWRRIYG